MAKGKKRNAIQYLYGDTNEVLVKVRTVKAQECNEIAVGDPVIMHMYKATTGTVNRQVAIPIGELADASVGDAAGDFAGISMSDSKDGDSDDIRVATTGVFEFPCTSATYNPGYLAVVKTGIGAGTSVDCDACTATTPAGAYVATFGRIVNKAASAATTCQVKIATKIFSFASVNCVQT